MNYNDKFDEIKKLLKIGMQRMITPLGRVAVLNFKVSNSVQTYSSLDITT